MEIGAASFSGAALQPQYPPQNTQSDYADTARTREQTAGAREAVTAASVQAARTEERNVQPEQQESAKIFVNAQGQKTGSIISVTA